MNSTTEQTQTISSLLAYPQQAAKILAVRSDLIDRKLIDSIERVSDRMKTNGSQEAATFLANLVTYLERLIDTTDINSLKSQEIEAFISSMTNGDESIQQPDTKAYRHLINALLTYPDRTTKLLTSHRHLLDQNLVKMIKKLAMFMVANGSWEAAVFLINLAMRLSATTVNLEVLEREQNHPKAIAQIPTKNRFKLFAGIALIAFSLLFIINQFNGEFLNLPSALVTNPANKLGKANTTPVATVSLKPVKEYRVSRSYSGRVVAKRNVDLSFPLSGRLTKIKVEEGESVKKDTPLAYLNTDTLHLKQQELLAKKAGLVAQLKELEAGPRPETIAAARAGVTDVREQLKLVTQKRLRRLFLYEQGAISREQFEEAVASESSLQARLNEAQSRLDELEAGTRSEQIEAQQALVEEINANIAKIVLELNKSVLKAPFTGTISKVQVDEGAIVSPDRSILRLVEDGVLEARIGIAIDRSEIEVGNTLPLKIADKIYQAKVTSLLPELDANTRTLTAVLTLKPSSTQIFPGQTAQLQLTKTKTIADAGFWLPITALVRGEKGLWYCYVAGKTDSESTRIERRAVEVLHGDSNRVLVRGTLRPGEKAIANDVDRLVPGQLVTMSNGQWAMSNEQ